MDLAYTATGRKKCEALSRDGKYRYYKNHLTPGEKDQLYQKNITKKGQVFNLSFTNTNGSSITHGMSTVRS